MGVEQAFRNEGMSPQKLWGPCGCLLGCLIFITTTGGENIEKEIKITEQLYTDSKYRLNLAKLASGVFKDKEFQEELKKFLATVGEPKEELDFSHNSPPRQNFG